jgi:F0F1-type ATP synthase membrane subunit b/b'
MVDVVMIVVIVAFFVAAALLVRLLGRVTEEASVEREPEIADTADAVSGQQHGLLPGQRR